MNSVIFKNYLKNIFYKIFNKKLLKNHPNWKYLLSDINFENKESLNGKKILVATSTGGHRLALSSEILFGLSLKARGARVDFLLCDEALSACSECTYLDFSNSRDFIKYGASLKCSSCWNTGKYSLLRAGIKTLKYSEFFNSSDLKQVKNIISKTDYKDIKNFAIDDIFIGEHAYAGLLRYYAKGNLEFSKDEIDIFKKYFFSALKTYFISKNLFSSIKFDSVVLNHGIYVPQGIISEVAKSYGLKVVTWFTAYKDKSFLFSNDETYHKSLLKEPVTDWENRQLNNKEEKKLDDYISSRKLGTKDWVYFHNKSPKFDFQISSFNNLEDQEFVSLFTNVVWDAQLFFDQNIFENMLDWLFQTIQYFIEKKKVLVVRAHPAEISGSLPSQQKIYFEIKKKFGELPKNIIFIAPEDSTSSYSIIEKSQFCIVYGSTIGTEIAAMGKNVIVGGEAWIKNKGISYDPKSKSEYFDFISELISKPIMNNEKHKRAKMYAYHFFFRRMIPINFIKKKKEKYQDIDIEKKNMNRIFNTDDSDKGIQTICDSILNNKNFIYEE